MDEPSNPADAFNPTVGRTQRGRCQFVRSPQPSGAHRSNVRPPLQKLAREDHGDYGRLKIQRQGRQAESAGGFPTRIAMACSYCAALYAEVRVGHASRIELSLGCATSDLGEAPPSKRVVVSRRRRCMLSRCRREPLLRIRGAHSK